MSFRNRILALPYWLPSREWLARRAARVQGERLHFEGVIRLRRLPDDWTEQDYAYWWLPERDEAGRLVRAARMSEREKARWQEAEFPNMLMVAGRTQILSYIGASSGNSTGFARYLAVGQGALMAPTPIDTQLVNETTRKALSAFTVQGTQVDCNFQFTASDAQGQMTEAGLFGGSATSTRNSGTLYTHALFSYTKGAYSIAVDYLINLL